MLGTVCVTLRDDTEWMETVETGWNHLVDLDPGRVDEALRAPRPQSKPELFGGGRGAQRICEVLLQSAADSSRRSR